jgi:hypothetical protein
MKESALGVSHQRMRRFARRLTNGRHGPPEKRRQQPFKVSQLLTNRSDQFCGIVHVEPPVEFGFADYYPNLRLTYFADNSYAHTTITHS